MKNSLNYSKRIWIPVAVSILVILAVLFYFYNKNIIASRVEAEQEKQDILLLVKGFGDTLKMVSITAPDDIAAKSIEEHYSDFVTPELLKMWQSDPKSAPGRTLSSPWPERIDVISIQANDDGTYTVSGEIVEVTIQNGDAAIKYPVTLEVLKQNNQWRISRMEIKEE